MPSGAVQHHRQQYGHRHHAAYPVIHIGTERFHQPGHRVGFIAPLGSRRRRQTLPNLGQLDVPQADDLLGTGYLSLQIYQAGAQFLPFYLRPVCLLLLDGELRLQRGDAAVQISIPDSGAVVHIGLGAADHAQPPLRRLRF